MSLRFRLNLFITLLFVLILCGTGAYVIHGARRSVAEEMRSTSNLALQLIDVILADADQIDRADLERYLIETFSRLESTRHLQIAVVGGGSGSAVPVEVSRPIRSAAPAWFVGLVRPTPMESRRILAGPGLPRTEIVIRADPSDEITEVWTETRSILLFLILFIVLANLLVYITLGRDLAPIEAIAQGLANIEKGEYRQRLPRFRIAELDRISDRFNHMAEVLWQSRENNRYLAQRSLEIQEQERRHLARELHDELGQSLSAIKAIATAVQGDRLRSAGTGDERVGKIADIAERTYDVARNMMQRLRPPALDELGLCPALQALVDSWNASHPDTFCALDVRQDSVQPGEEIAINLYRIVQEALTNVARHAGASRVTVRLAREDQSPGGGNITLSISDDGRGLPEKPGPGLGLIGMRERVEAMNGEFRLESRPGNGVNLRVTIPISAAGGKA